MSYVCMYILLSPARSSPEVPVTPLLPQPEPLILIQSCALLAAPIAIIRDTLKE